MDYIVSAANLRAYMFGIKGILLIAAFSVFCFVSYVFGFLLTNQSEPMLNPVTH